MKNKYSNFYNVYHTKDLHPVVNFMQQQRVDTIKSLLPKKGKILIVGCGSGYDMSVINNEMDGYGVDISKEAVKKSRVNFPQHKYQVSSATKLPFENNLFDVVVCSEVIEHVPNRDKAFKEIHRVLKKGGKFIVTTPNWLSFYGLARWVSESIFGKPATSGEQLYDKWSTPFSLKKELKDKGLNVEEFRGIWFYPPFGKGMKQLPADIILPVVSKMAPLDSLLGKISPWFGHMILYKSKKL
jgi:ubiquinone/menaquinone biosynthesis C-methylase UbiE